MSVYVSHALASKAYNARREEAGERLNPKLTITTETTAAPPTTTEVQIGLTAIHNLSEPQIINTIHPYLLL